MSALTKVSRLAGLASLRAMARAVLPSLSWRHHGIGALQGYVSEGNDVEVRIHIWSPRLVKPGMEASGAIHDHRFDMVSHVLAGGVGHEEWFASPDVDGAYETLALTHARAAADSKFHGPVTPTGERFAASCNPMFIPEGYSYSYPAGCFHRSTVPTFAVTCVEKHGQRAIPARVLHPASIPPVMAFGHDLDAALLVELIKQADVALARAA